MELKHDWRAFNSVLFPQETIQVGRKGNESARRLVVLEEGGSIVDGVVSSGAWFQDSCLAGQAEASNMSKERLDGLSSKYGVEQTLSFQRRDIDQAIADAAEVGSNYYQQLELIRSRAQELVNAGGTSRSAKKAATMMVSRRHFVLDLLTGPVGRFLPKSFNFLIFIDTSTGGVGPSYNALLLSYAQGKLDQFFEPDFSSLHENRLVEWAKESDKIGEYLESRYILPCYGIFMTKPNWDRCVLTSTQGRNPWLQFLKSCDTGTAALYPHNAFTKTLLASQKVMVYFSRS